MKNPNVAKAVFLIVTGAAAAGACSDTTAAVSSNCVPGVTRKCDADAGCQVAIEECAGSPPAWGPCHCVFAAPDSAPPPPPPPVEAGLPLVGTYCRSDRECAPGTFCLNRASNYYFEGGPPKGVCVADCSADPTVCRNFADATCVGITLEDAPLASTDGGAAPDAATDSGDAASGPADSGPKGASDAATNPGSDAATADAQRDGSPHVVDSSTRDARNVPPVRVPTSLCMKSCRLGPGSADKCYGVANVACAPHPSGSGNEGFCRPLCASNADCTTTADGPSRACDVRSGVCVDTPGNVDVALGRTCDAKISVLCNGECVPISGSTSICTHRCIIGVPLDCGESTTDEFGGACLETPAGRGAGDVGYCRKLCNCPKDCGAANLVCVAFDNPDYQPGFKRYGVCTPDSLVTGEPLKCD